MSETLNTSRVAQRGTQSIVRTFLAFLWRFIGRKRAAIAQLGKENTFLREEVRRQVCELERCETAHRQSERSFHLLADQLTELVWIMCPAGQTEFFNRRWRAYTGLQGDDSKQEGWRMILHPEDLQRFFASGTMAYAAGYPYRAEFRLKPVDAADYRWCSFHVFPQRDPTGKIERWIGVAFTGDEVVDDGAPTRCHPGFRRRSFPP